MILRLRDADDAAAWQEFVEIYQPLIFRLARAKGLQDADAGDLTQEVLTRVARSVSRWNPDPTLGTFRGWISRITRNLVIEFLRARHRLPAATGDSGVRRLFEQQIQPGAESELFDLEYERQVFSWAANKLMSAFTKNTWQAFWLTAVENRPVPDVARQLGMSSGAVYIARSRIMARLRESVQRVHNSESALVRQ
jgi:RNA polymerase sigma-70 factor (ECF subfamily)